MAISVPGNILAIAQSIDSQLWPVLIAISYYESGFSPGAVGDNGCSLGLMQFNTCGGLGAGHSQAELFDPHSNLQLAANYINSELRSGVSLYDALQPWTTRSQAWVLIQSGGIPGANTAIASGGGQPATADNSGLWLLGLALVGVAIVWG